MNQSIELHVEGVPTCTTHTLHQGHGLVIGRAPEAACESLQRAGGDVQLTALTLGANAVSSAHACVAQTNDGRVVVRDLDSTNETWVLLARKQSITVQTDGAPLRVAIGMGGPSWQLHDDPPTPEWARREDYPEAVRAAVERWCQEHAIPATVTKSRNAPSMEYPDLSWFPLRDEWGLRVTSTRATFALDDRLTQRLHAWVRTQNELFDNRERVQRGGVVMESAATRDAMLATIIASKHNFRLLLTGPSGSGKSTFAELYHSLWNAEAPYVSVNSSQFGADPNLNHSILFGMAPGAIPNAPRGGTRGYVGHADGGTLFFDEIADLPLDTQANLLTFLDKGNYRPLGGGERHAVVRVVSATNKDMRALIAAGKFRADLWYRLRGAEVTLTSLGDRPEDLAMFLQRMDQRHEREVLDALTAEARAMLFVQPWDGGFRDVTYVIQQLFMMKSVRRAARIGPDMMAEAITSASTSRAPAVRSRPAASAPLVLTPPSTGRQPVHPRWRAIVDEALQWFFDEGERDLRYPTLNDFINEYLKPTFAAHGCDLASARTFPANMSPRALGQKIDLGRETVVVQLQRYFSRP